MKYSYDLPKKVFRTKIYQLWANDSPLCILMGDKSPFKPRYTFVWDVEVGLRFTATHLALTYTLRVSIAQHLNARFIVKESNKTTFHFNKLHKSWRRWAPLPSICYYSYPEEPELCVVRNLEEYLRMSELC